MNEVPIPWKSSHPYIAGKLVEDDLYVSSSVGGSKQEPITTRFWEVADYGLVMMITWARCLHAA